MILSTLWSTITNKGNSALEIRRRLAMAREAVSKMGNIWRSRRVSLNLKLRVLWATAYPIGIYGSESWTMQKADERRVDDFEMWCYRRVLRIPWTERKTNAWVLDKIGNKLMLREMVYEGESCVSLDMSFEGRD